MDFMFPLGVYLTITQKYNKATHLGVDFGWNSAVAGATNQPIVAAEAGTVVTAVDGYDCTWPASRIYGNHVIIDHGAGWHTVYAHMYKGSIAVKPGQTVAKGAQLGKMGNSGYCEQYAQHLHFELRKGGNAQSYSIDPLDYLTVQNDIVISDKTLSPDRIKRGEVIPTVQVGEPVQRDAAKHQVEVVANNLRARKRPELSDAVVLGYISPGIYDVLEAKDMTAEASNGYLWYRVADATWIATKPGEWTNDLPAGTADEPAADDKDRRIAELEAIIAEARAILEKV